MGTETQGAAEGLNLLVLGESDAEGARASLAGERKQGGTTGERKREKKRKSAGKGAAEGAASSEKGCWVAARNWVVTGSSLK